MFEALFAKLVLGHLVGDYLLQTKKMAIKKKEPGWSGLAWCLAHCLLYTAAVCLFLWDFHPAVIGIIFLSHFPLDRWSLTNKWLKLIGARTFEAAYAAEEPYRPFDISFTCIVYAVSDNALHLAIMWLALGHLEFFKSLL